MSKRLEMLETIIAGGSTDPFVYYARGLELRSLGRVPEAAEALGAVIERFPDYVPSYLMAGQVAEELGDLELARGRYAAGGEVAREAGDAHAVGELGAALDALDER